MQKPEKSTKLLQDNVLTVKYGSILISRYCGLTMDWESWKIIVSDKVEFNCWGAYVYDIILNAVGIVFDIILVFGPLE